MYGFQLLFRHQTATDSSLIGDHDGPVPGLGQQAKGVPHTR